MQSDRSMAVSYSSVHYLFIPVLSFVYDVVSLVDVFRVNYFCLFFSQFLFYGDHMTLGME